MAFSRYKNTTGVRYSSKDNYHLETPVFIPASELVSNISCITVEYNESTRLDALASQYLGDGRYWWAICMMNNFNSPYDPKLTVGSLIKIPKNITDLVNFMNKK
jgi:hypothetical protein